ncbi:MAG: DUF2608 domain-containing protein [Oligoflexia bacterium]|nr:DUF2608 domain-containing protein [Oligoflexia bacterium]
MKMKMKMKVKAAFFYLLAVLFCHTLSDQGWAAFVSDDDALKIAAGLVIWTPNMDLSCSVRSEKISSSNSDQALMHVHQRIMEKIQRGECRASDTLFVYDIDETVLMVDPNFYAHRIRNSDQVINSLQGQGIATLALTARYAVLPINFQFIQEQFSLLRQNKISQQQLSKQVFPAFLQHHGFAYANLKEAGIIPEQNNTLFSDEYSNKFDLFSLGPQELGDYENPSFLSRIMLYFKGVILASNQPKGEVLKHFLTLKNLSSRFKCIFYVDDNKSHIDNMNETFAPIPSLRLHSYHLPLPEFIFVPID